MTVLTRRYLCSVLDDIGSCWKTRNFSSIKPLVDEAQLYADAMESALSTNNSFCEGIDKILKGDAAREKKLERIRRLLDKVYDPDLPRIGRDW